MFSIDPVGTVVCARGHWFFNVLVAVVVLVPLTSSASQKDDIPWMIDGDHPASATFRARDKTVLPHLDTVLYHLARDWMEGQDKAALDAAARGVKIEDGRVRVTIRLLSEHFADRAMSAVQAMGGEITAHFQSAVDATIPIDQLEAVDVLEGLSLVHRLIPPEPREALSRQSNRGKAGSYLTQGVAASNADSWHVA
ncbi:MAG: hypothetical protein K8R59_18620, partial [Thermoanaerobaculales bacterium]|nr:hypothetical protein [Thermoanaerobaculales bacterium]